MVSIRACHARDRGSIPREGVWHLPYASYTRIRCYVRVVKEMDLKSIGFYPRRFKSCWHRTPCIIIPYVAQYVCVGVSQSHFIAPIAQLVRAPCL